MYGPEVYRVSGELCLKGPTPDVQAAEAQFQKSLDAARAEEAKGWELRTATSLARLYQEQGKLREARDLLAPVYAWFTEGSDTSDLRAAKTLLDQLS
jgi:predicted ATPase